MLIPIVSQVLQRRRQRLGILTIAMVITLATTASAATGQEDHLALSPNQTNRNTTSAPDSQAHPQVEEYVRSPSSLTVWIIGALFLMTILVKTLPTLIIYLVYGPPPKMRDQEDGEDELTMRHRASKRKMSQSTSVMNGGPGHGEARGRRGSSNSNSAVAENTKL